MTSKFTLAVSLTFSLLLVNRAPADDRQPRATQIEALINELIDDKGIPGLTVAAATNNELFFAKGFGYADVENLVPATTETRYRTASIAKPITAVAVLSLVESGAIDLDAEVQRYCDSYPEKKWPLTSRQLLGHLGGVRHYKKKGESTSTARFFDLESALKTFRDDPLIHQPGSAFKYTTFGYNLLGSIAEGSVGQSFPDVLSARVFAPSGMTQTVVDSQHKIIAARARGYIRPTKARLKSYPERHDFVPGQLYNAPLHDTSMKVPGGGLLSTASDLVRFAVAVNTGKLLRDETRKQMLTVQRTTDGKPTGYGLGWRIGRHAGRRIVSHTGGQSGTSTVLVLVPETGTAVAIMCNLQHASLRQTAVQVADLIQPRPAETDYSKVTAKLQDAIQYEIESKQIPSLSIALVDGDRPVWAAGFGFQDTSSEVKATEDTVYRVGSVSKLFTDIAVMQQVERQKLDLDKPVKTYLPEFRPNSPLASSITLRQLMSHQSGLVRESPVGNYFDPSEPSLKATVDSLNQTSLVYPPGTKTKYSNAAIAVVGAVLERSVGGSHSDAVRESILDPLKMHNSSFRVTDSVQKRLATGWMRTYDGRRFEAPEFLLGTGPAGNMYSSVVDLSNLLVCMFDEGTFEGVTILRPETFRAMIEPSRDANGKPQSFGIGFHLQNLDGETKIGHGGAVYGFSTQLEALPDRRLGVAAVASLDGSNGVVRRLSDYALRLMMATQDDEPLPEYVKTVPLAHSRALELVGTYREANGDRVARIGELGGEVSLALGSYQYQLRAREHDGTIVTDDLVGFAMEVKRIDARRISIQDIVFERSPKSVPADADERFKGLIGEYGWDHNTLYILEDHGKLYALIEWFYYYPLTEVDEDTFEFPDYGLYHGEGLKFKRDNNGIATEVVAAEVRFLRREVGTKDGETFRITPVKPIADLRACALAASPPDESGDFRDADLVDLATLDPTIKMDIRYATTNNFTGAVFYRQPRAFMQRPAAEALVRVHQRLAQRGLGLLIHDAYRPWHVTKMFWDATPSEMKDFVANPANGSRHNRGCAVDLTLYDLVSGDPIQMVAGYDEFSPRSFPAYPGGTSRQRWYRDLLRASMQAEQFTVYEFEWWHFDFKDWKKYRIGNATFEQLQD